MGGMRGDFDAIGIFRCHKVISLTGGGREAYHRRTADFFLIFYF